MPFVYFSKQDGFRETDRVRSILDTDLPSSLTKPYVASVEDYAARYDRRLRDALPGQSRDHGRISRGTRAGFRRRDPELPDHVQGPRTARHRSRSPERVENAAVFCPRNGPHLADPARQRYGAVVLRRGGRSVGTVCARTSGTHHLQKRWPKT